MNKRGITLVQWLRPEEEVGGWGWLVVEAGRGWGVGDCFDEEERRFVHLEKPERLP